MAIHTQQNKRKRADAGIVAHKMVRRQPIPDYLLDMGDHWTQEELDRKDAEYRRQQQAKNNPPSRPKNTQGKKEIAKKQDDTEKVRKLHELAAKLTSSINTNNPKVKQQVEQATASLVKDTQTKHGTPTRTFTPPVDSSFSGGLVVEKTGLPKADYSKNKTPDKGGAKKTPPPPPNLPPKAPEIDYAVVGVAGAVVVIAAGVAYYMYTKDRF
jgi:hypothetical protein